MGGANFWYANDALGSVMALVNSSAAVAQRNFYAPFGETINSSGAFAPLANAVNQPFAFSGYAYDAGSDLSYFGARYLDSAWYAKPVPTFSDALAAVQQASRRQPTSHVSRFNRRAI